MKKKNYAASVKQQLLNRAQRDQRPFNELLQYYAMERFLYRLAQSHHAKRFILKGALMLRVWQVVDCRPTMDIDMLGKTSNQEAYIIAQMKEILDIEIDDGLHFNSASIKTENIMEEADYEGVKIKFQAKLGSAVIHMQVDIGFGDIVYPAPQEGELRALLSFPPPRLLCYSRESVIVEKFNAMVMRGITNSRMKDFFDVWLLSRQFNFKKQTLTEATRLTFGQRKTEITNEIIAFSEEFTAAKQSQWELFRKRLQMEYVPVSFKEIVLAVSTFLSPIVLDLYTENIVPDKWEAPGPWK